MIKSPYLPITSPYVYELQISFNAIPKAILVHWQRSRHSCSGSFCHHHRLFQCVPSPWYCFNPDTLGLTAVNPNPIVPCSLVYGLVYSVDSLCSNDLLTVCERIKKPVTKSSRCFSATPFFPCHFLEITSFLL
ncbi:hypothetical protein HYPBUDRAFT_179315 [Hyphopichia burtonii NRRL Y-1933]|uniref:Uncharacterized protein n=1 Tax=Hyphopichia burtonii NRRL Y-1933 TaxID=984485 RepID=A0A1E4RSK4_9ASCO|nr:hypothetical protein HYPBUDRAFT_179315 [Hyphopichia burtonii NRRL Y-1933]ODV70161.1 hypothetical protein HYPBUDRAFT_179315 [Hyphopichia burtonii NRRL Y-1933]